MKIDLIVIISLISKWGCKLKRGKGKGKFQPKCLYPPPLISGPYVDFSPVPVTEFNYKLQFSFKKSANCI